LPREFLFLALSFFLLCSVIRGSDEISGRESALCIIIRKTPTLALSLLSWFIHSRKQKSAGSVGDKMPKTVVTLRRILTVIIPFIYIFFVTGKFNLFWYIHVHILYVKKYIYLENNNTGEKRKKNMFNLVCGNNF
jgi:hypothetical protein